MSSQSPTKKRPPEADEVIIELDSVDWRRFDVWYREYQDKPDNPLYPEWKKKKEEFLDSAALRVKNRVLMCEAVKEGYRGKFPLHVIYDEMLQECQSINHVNYKVMSTKPKGELEVTENTKVVLTVSRLI